MQTHVSGAGSAIDARQCESGANPFGDAEGGAPLRAAAQSQEPPPNGTQVVAILQQQLTAALAKISFLQKELDNARRANLCSQETLPCLYDEHGVLKSGVDERQCDLDVSHKNMDGLREVVDTLTEVSRAQHK